LFQFPEIISIYFENFEISQKLNRSGNYLI